MLLARFLPWAQPHVEEVAAHAPQPVVPGRTGRLLRQLEAGRHRAAGPLADGGAARVDAVPAKAAGPRADGVRRARLARPAAGLGRPAPRAPTTRCRRTSRRGSPRFRALRSEMRPRRAGRKQTRMRVAQAVVVADTLFAPVGVAIAHVRGSRLAGRTGSGFSRLPPIRSACTRSCTRRWPRPVPPAADAETLAVPADTDPRLRALADTLGAGQPVAGGEDRADSESPVARVPVFARRGPVHLRAARRRVRLREEARVLRVLRQRGRRSCSASRVCPLVTSPGSRWTRRRRSGAITWCGSRMRMPGSRRGSPAAAGWRWTRRPPATTRPCTPAATALSRGWRSGSRRGGRRRLSPCARASCARLVGVVALPLAAVLLPIAGARRAGGSGAAGAHGRLRAPRGGLGRRPGAGARDGPARCAVGAPRARASARTARPSSTFAARPPGAFPPALAGGQRRRDRLLLRRALRRPGAPRARPFATSPAASRTIPRE